MPEAELLIVADGAVEDCAPLAREVGARVFTVPGPVGPATARNRAAREATGDILVFVDSDVVVAPDAVPRLAGVLADEPAVAAVFGAYDHEPAAANFMSQFKNLSHTYVHEIGRREASTFWAGLGAIRAAVFHAVGGFDERFARPSVEDIELGYRVIRAGGRIRLNPEARGKHLKRWTLSSCVVTDVRARGVPWTQLIHRYGALANDLNTSQALRWSVVLSYLVVGSLGAAVFTPWAFAATAALGGTLVLINLDYYRWFSRERGLLFAVRVIPIHLLHHLCNGASFVIGTVLHLGGRRGIRVGWSLPPGVWTGRARGDARLAGGALPT
jgi:glycosyltransferase involved in cell wall biosynthesis